MSALKLRSLGSFAFLSVIKDIRRFCVGLCHPIFDVGQLREPAGYHQASRCSVAENPPAVQDMWVPSLGQGDPLEKEIATPSSIRAGIIPRTEEPGRLQSTGWKQSDILSG